MRRTTFGKLLATAAMLSSIETTTHAQDHQAESRTNISFIQIDRDITLRRMVVGNPDHPWLSPTITRFTLSTGPVTGFRRGRRRTVSRMRRWTMRMS
jgi:hypothetical protein